MKKQGLYAVGQGGGCSKDKKINLISIAFNYNGTMDIELAKKLIVKSSDSLLAKNKFQP